MILEQAVYACVASPPVWMVTLYAPLQVVGLAYNPEPGRWAGHVFRLG